MPKYCGYEIPNEITPEQIERLHNFFLANFSKKDFIELTQEALNAIAKANETEWKW